MTHSRQLELKLEVVGQTMFGTLDDLWARPDVSELIAPFFVLLHQIMRASVPMLERAEQQALAHAAKEVGAGPYSELAAYLRRHADEEREHDIWMAEDLDLLGVSAQDLEKQMPSQNVAALVGAQYYLIDHFDPVVILGYMAVLEGFPPREEHIDRLIARTGLPAESFRTYRLHGKLDPRHRLDILRMVDVFPSPVAQARIGASATHTMAGLAICVNDILERSQP